MTANGTEVEYKYVFDLDNPLHVNLWETIARRGRSGSVGEYKQQPIFADLFNGHTIFSISNPQSLKPGHIFDKQTITWRYKGTDRYFDHVIDGDYGDRIIRNAGYNLRLRQQSNGQFILEFKSDDQRTPGSSATARHEVGIEIKIPQEGLEYDADGRLAITEHTRDIIEQAVFTFTPRQEEDKLFVKVLKSVYKNLDINSLILSLDNNDNEGEHVSETQSLFFQPANLKWREVACDFQDRIDKWLYYRGVKVAELTLDEIHNLPPDSLRAQLASASVDIPSSRYFGMEIEEYFDPSSSEEFIAEARQALEELNNKLWELGVMEPIASKGKIAESYAANLAREYKALLQGNSQPTP
jgi:hypothetical protein